MNIIDFLVQKNIEIGGGLKPFNNIENERLAKMYYSLSPKEQELFFLNNCKLVVKIAQNYSSYNSDYALQEELILSGIVGLQTAIDNFDPNKGQFYSFAWGCIRNEMLHFLKYHNKHQPNIELDAPILDDKVLTQLDLIMTLLENRIDIIYQQDLIKDLMYMIEELDDRDFFILVHSYGIGEYEKMTQLQIAQVLSTSRSYISIKKMEIEKRLYKQLKSYHQK